MLHQAKCRRASAPWSSNQTPPAALPRPESTRRPPPRPRRCQRAVAAGRPAATQGGARGANQGAASRFRGSVRGPVGSRQLAGSPPLHLDGRGAGLPHDGRVRVVGGRQQHRLVARVEEGQQAGRQRLSAWRDRASGVRRLLETPRGCLCFGVRGPRKRRRARDGRSPPLVTIT